VAQELLKPKINFEPRLAQTHQNLAKPFSVPLHPCQDQYYLLVLVFHGTPAKKKGQKRSQENEAEIQLHKGFLI